MNPFETKVDNTNSLQNLSKDDLFKIVDEYFMKNYYSASPKIPPHSHNQIDNLPIDPSTLTGFPVMSKVPTDTAQNGVIRFYYDGSNYRIYVRINNTWVGGTLT